MLPRNWLPSALVGAGFLLAAALPAAGQTPPSDSAAPADSAALPPKQAFVVAAIGDSLTDARSNGGKYLDYLREYCPESRFDNYGKGGNMVNQMQRRFARDILGEPAVDGVPAKPAYTHVIVFGGVNDITSDVTALRTNPKIERDLTSMYALAHEHGMKVVALTVAPWGGFKRYYNARRGASTHELNAWIKGQHDTGAVDAVVDAFGMLSCGNPNRLCPQYVKPFNDGLHFNAAAHRKLGEALHREVFSQCR